MKETKERLDCCPWYIVLSQIDSSIIEEEIPSKWGDLASSRFSSNAIQESGAIKTLSFPGLY